MDYTIFRERLRGLIDGRGMSPRAFSIDAGISTPTISRYLSGARLPELQYVIRIAEYFGVSTDWLLGIESDRNSSYSEEVRTFADLFSLASEDDKLVINTILRKYK